jgi:hypothetical protein
MSELLLLLYDELIRRGGGGDVAVGSRSLEAFVDGGGDGLERDLTRKRRETAEQDRVGQRTPQVLQGEFRRRAREEAFAVERSQVVAEP